MSARFTTRVALLAACALLCAPVAASAHGDAASHYLETTSLYAAFGNQPSEQTELELIGLLDAAKRAHYPLKVALIANETDVLDMPEMLGKPQAYAEYVVGALKGVRVAVDAPVLVISPSGLGLAGPKPPGGLAGIAPAAGATGEDLAVAAKAAVRALATASGHPLPADVPPAKVPLVAPKSAPSSGYGLGGLTPFVVFAAIFGSAVALYEGRSRLARRRAHITPTGGAA
ncbi:hypothetical protein [Solirubrobacter soli]|uniref:hypothetical protein n=1 Tax=Solirubrobacter soli TaxID=363832 RepID=UPI0004180AC8|nr:hypothetical protein [Solirubrobacter soli]